MQRGSVCWEPLFRPARACLFVILAAKRRKHAAHGVSREVSVAGFRSLPASIGEFDGSSGAFGWFDGSALRQKV